MDYAEIDAPVGASGTVSSENDFSDITFSTLNYTISSTLRPSHSSPKEYQFDGRYMHTITIAIALMNHGL